jgi:hypothetical protein
MSNRELEGSVERALLLNNPQLAGNREQLTQTVTEVSQGLAARGFERVDKIEQLPSSAGLLFTQGQRGQADFRQSEVTFGQAVTMVNGGLAAERERLAAAQAAGQPTPTAPAPGNAAPGAPAQPAQPSGFSTIENGVRLGPVTGTLTTPADNPNARQITVTFTDPNERAILQSASVTALGAANPIAVNQVTGSATLRVDQTLVTPQVGVDLQRNGTVLGATVSNPTGTTFATGQVITGPNGAVNLGAQLQDPTRTYSGGFSSDRQTGVTAANLGVVSNDGRPANPDANLQAVPPSVSVTAGYTQSPAGQIATAAGAFPTAGPDGTRVGVNAQLSSVPGQPSSANVTVGNGRDPNRPEQLQGNIGYTAPGVNPANGQPTPSGVGGGISYFDFRDPKLTYGGAVTVAPGLSSVTAATQVAINPNPLNSVQIQAGATYVPSTGQVTPQASITGGHGNVEGGRLTYGASVGQDPNSGRLDGRLAIGFQQGERIPMNADGTAVVTQQQRDQINRSVEETTINGRVAMLTGKDATLYQGVRGQLEQWNQTQPEASRMNEQTLRNTSLEIARKADDAGYNQVFVRMGDVRDGKQNIFYSDQPITNNLTRTPPSVDRAEAAVAPPLANLNAMTQNNADLLRGITSANPTVENNRNENLPNPTVPAPSR